MARSLRDNIAKQKALIRQKSLEIILDETRPFNERIVDLICAHELPRYDWITDHVVDVDKNDKRLDLLRKIASSDMAVFLYSSFGRPAANYGAFGNGIVVCKLDIDNPWSIKVADDDGPRQGREVRPTDVSLVAHPIPDTATAFFHMNAGSRHYVASSDNFESPGMRKVSTPTLEVKLPTEPIGIDSFAMRLHQLGQVAGYGASGVVELARKVAVMDHEPTAQVTLLHAALSYYAADKP